MVSLRPRNKTLKKKKPLCTVIVTASFIQSHPSIEFIKCTLESLKKHANLPLGTPIILAHDYSDDEKYKEYLTALENYVADKPAMKIVVRDSFGALVGNLRNAFKYVSTDYVLVIQHDLPFVRSFSLEKVIQDMKHNPELKHVRFNKRTTTKTASNSVNDLFGKQVRSVNYTYTRTPSWSDNNHLCSSKYYRSIILKESPDGTAMESVEMGKSVDEETHLKYGTYIFGKVNDKAYIRHTDGRNRMTTSCV